MNRTLPVQIIIGDALTELRKLAAGSAHCCVTSPPYWGLRDYGVAGQLGLEPTPEEHVAAMVEVFREVRRVLRDDATAWVNYGDCFYSSPSGFAGTEVPFGAGPPSRGAVAYGRVKRPPHSTLKPKDLVGMPWRVAFALQADGWYLRSDVIWHKPNPMPEGVTDRPTKAHEYVFLLAKQARYYYDADAVREESITGDPRRPYWSEGALCNKPPVTRRVDLRPKVVSGESSPEYRNARTVWTIPTHAFPEAHFATFPPALAERCIKAGCPAGGVVLDPFGGAGTTGLVADRLGRSATLIELNPEYAAIAKRRITNDCPLFTEVEIAVKETP